MSDKPTIDITLDGAPRTIEAGTTGTLLLQDAYKFGAPADSAAATKPAMKESTEATESAESGKSN